MHGNQQARYFHWKGMDKEQKLPYLLYLPPTYQQENKDKQWPLLLFLHGMGERGDDLERVGHHALPRLISEGQDFPFIILSPQCPRDKRWQDADMVELLSALLDEIERACNVDPDRVLVTGLSMGGFGTWALIQSHPQCFAAAVPICGGGDPARADAIRHLPIWVFHGEKDDVVPFHYSQRMVDALKACESDVRFTVYPDVRHNSWDPAYATPELYSWLLAQRR
jgi:predicted peptidase